MRAIDSRLAVTPRPVWAGLALLGAAEVPWVLYLWGNEPLDSRVFHVQLAAAGLGLAAAVLALAAGLATLVRRLAALWLATATATLLGFSTMLITVSGQSAAAVPAREEHRAAGLVALGTAVAVAVVAALAHRVRRGLEAPVVRSVRPPLSLGVAGVVLVLLGTAYAVHTGIHLHRTDTGVMFNARGVLVWLDSAESAALLTAGLAARVGRARTVYIAGTVAATLLLTDAFLNIVLVPSGPALTAALVYFVIGECPASALSVLAVRSAGRVIRAGGAPRAR